MGSRGPPTGVGRRSARSERSRDTAVPYFPLPPDMPLARPCLDCGQLGKGTRCSSCERERQRRRGSPTRRGYDYEWGQLSRATIARQPWCSICGSTDDLTTDHVVPGSLEQLRVLCRRCHGKHGAQRNRKG